jgi:hypothetical protein
MTSQLERIAPRPVTSEELAFFDEHGWVKLEQLIPAQQAGVLLERLKEKMGEHGLDGEHPDGDATTARWRVFAPLSVDKVTGAVRDDLYHSFSHSPELGRVGEAFLGGPVRYWIDQALVKAPAGEAGSGETSWHIDIGDKGTSPFDPPAQINICMALADVTAEHGSMRFVSPKDLTDEIKQSVEGRPVEETIPELERLGIVSERLDLRPGDALALPTDAGPWETTVAAIYPDYGNVEGQLMVSLDALAARWHDVDRRRLGVRAAPLDLLRGFSNER